MTPRLIISLSAAAGFVLCSCGENKTASAPAGSPVIAKAGDDVITADDVQKEVQRRLAKNLTVPDKSALVEEMLERLAAVSRAKKEKLDTDAETKREMENVLIAKLRALELEKKLAEVSVSDDELKAAYQAGSAGYARPAKVRLALLQIRGDAKMSDAKRGELRARMDEALKKAAASPAEGGRGAAATGFGQVAAEYSDDQVSRYRGGDIGWLDAGNFGYHWPKAVLEAGYALEEGKCSGVIDDGGSLYAVMKTGVREAGATTFEEVKPALRHSLLAKKRAAAEAAFLADNRSRTGAEVRTEALSSLTIPSSPARPSREAADSTPPALPGMNPPSR